ncbi:MAG: hypothetical protein ACKVZJ_12325 [Phycisphaerales bacterium]
MPAVIKGFDPRRKFAVQSAGDAGCQQQFHPVEQHAGVLQIHIAQPDGGTLIAVHEEDAALAVLVGHE